MPIYAEKICDLHILLKYAKNVAICEIYVSAYLRKILTPKYLSHFFLTSPHSY